MIFVFIIIGLIVGSFLNVVILRIHSGEGGILLGHSHCTTCNHALTWQDNIPLVSYLLLFGRCRYCKKTLSIQYPLVEGTTAFLFAFVAYALTVSIGPSWILAEAFFICGVVASLIVIFVYDLRYMEVPMVVVWMGVVSALSAVIMRDVAGGAIVSVWDVVLVYHLIAGAVAFLFFFCLSYFSQETWMGYGDGYVALVIGLFLGPIGAFVAILIAVWSGAFIGIALTFVHKKTMKSAIPFGPFLVAGAIASFGIIHMKPEWLTILW